MNIKKNGSIKTGPELYLLDISKLHTKKASLAADRTFVFVHVYDVSRHVEPTTNVENHFYSSSMFCYARLVCS
jgi:hypothetical protein